MFYILKHSFTSLSLIIMPSETDVAPGWVGWDGLGRKSLGGAIYAKSTYGILLVIAIFSRW